jgi:hypothetical protein
MAQADETAFRESFWFMQWGEIIDNVARYAYLDDVLVLVFAFWLRIRTALGVMAVGQSAVTRPASTWMRRLVRTASSIRRS